ncbi:MAG: hypothetical protein K6E73_11375 [Bacteroidales bacterium]|nr:hypothetical protein [Bacteroidales bacterium]
MKKTYIQPAIQEIKLDLSQVICQSLTTDAGFQNPQPGSGVGRAARSRDWQDWEGTY